MILLALACMGSEPEPDRLFVRLDLVAPGRTIDEVELLVPAIEAALSGHALRIETTSWDQRAQIEAWVTSEPLDVSLLPSRLPDDVELFFQSLDRPAQPGTLVVVGEGARARAEQMAGALQMTPCVAQVDVRGGAWRPHVRVDPERLVAFSLTMGDVVGAMSSEPLDKAMVGTVPLVDIATLTQERAPERASWDGEPAVLIEVVGQGCAGGIAPVLGGHDAVAWVPGATDVRVDVGWANPRDVDELSSAAQVLGAEHVLVRWSGEQGPVRLVALQSQPREVYEGLRTVAAGHPGSDARVRWDGRAWRRLVLTGPRELLLDAAAQVEQVAGDAGLEVERARVPSRVVTNVSVDREMAARLGVPVREVAFAHGTHDVGRVDVTLGSGDWEQAVVAVPLGSIPLTALADIVREVEPVELVRFDGQPAVSVHVQAPERQDLAPMLASLQLPEGVSVSER